MIQMFTFRNRLYGRIRIDALLEVGLYNTRGSTNKII